MEILKNIGNKVFTGPGFHYINYGNIDTNGELNPFPELVDGNAWGLKWVIVQDTRNNLLNASTGHFYDFELGYNFSDANYTHVVVDLRKYYTWKEKFIFAGRFFNSLNFGNSPPFFDQSFLGGDRYVRGYYYGRFRDQNLSTIQLEARSILVWRLGLALFGGASSVYHQLDEMDLKPNFGLGLRFVMDRSENVNLRFDYAVGSDGADGFYISFGESF